MVARNISEFEAKSKILSLLIFFICLLLNALIDFPKEIFFRNRHCIC